MNRGLEKTFAHKHPQAGEAQGPLNQNTSLAQAYWLKLYAHAEMLNAAEPR
jgi:hypothetical protein